MALCEIFIIFILNAKLRFDTYWNPAYAQSGESVGKKHELFVASRRQTPRRESATSSCF